MGKSITYLLKPFQLYWEYFLTLTFLISKRWRGKAMPIDFFVRL